MEVRVKRKSAKSHKTGCLIIGRFEGRSNNTIFDEVDNEMEGLLSRAVKSGDFKGKLNEIAFFYSNGKIPAERVILVGLGKKQGFSIEKLREASGTSANVAKRRGVPVISTTLPQALEGLFSSDEIAQAIVEGTLLSLYSFDTYKTEKDKNGKKVSLFNLLVPPKSRKNDDFEEGALKGQIISKAVYFTRNLILEPGNRATPSYIADQTLEAAKKNGMKVTLLGPDQIKTHNMGGLLGVARGSNEDPRFIIVEYSGGKKNDRPYVLVGKAVTFDSGGISIKPSEGMEKMKKDMSGGATVIGAILAASAMKLPLNIVALIPATENLPGGRAYKPGDILTSMSGLTVEVVNTDAEGRLILADALTYAERYKPKAVVDVATLTGAIIVALGNHATGLMGNNRPLVKKLIKAGEETGERLWELPLWEPYKEQINSPVADIKNVGGKGAGTITAAAFLERFAKKYAWAHLDIAGTAWTEEDKSYAPKGATGIGVRLLVRFLQNLAKN